MIVGPNGRPGELSRMATELADLARDLPGLCEQLEWRLHALEPFRALQQLAQREAGGKPVEAIASDELRAHLDGELAKSQDYRVLQLLRALHAEFDGALFAQAAAEPAALALPIVAQAAATDVTFDEPNVEAVAMSAEPVEQEPQHEPAVNPIVSVAPLAAIAPSEIVPQWQTDDLHAEASQAVASMFDGVAPVAASEIAGPPLLENELAQSAPTIERPIAEPPEVGRLDLEAPVALPPEPVQVASNMIEIAVAEATVMASLAKLRAAEEVAARLAAAAFASPPTVQPRSPSMDGAMANVAAAVAATVAAANRIAEPKSNGAPAAREAPAPPPIRLKRERPVPMPPISAVAEATEIRFVERPASPMLDIVPRAKPAPLADVPIGSIVSQRPLANVGEHAARDWEEAVVEIRRTGPDRTPTPEPSRTQPGFALAGRAGFALGRFVKSLKGE